MAGRVFMTGFPGFIARRLVDRLVAHDPDSSFAFLIEERLRASANASVQQLDEKYPGFAGRAKLIGGDITALRLGLSKREYQSACDDVEQVWHLAACYDLAAPASAAYRTNVVGTANVLDFCDEAQSLRRLDYVSTCYVSGTRTGLVLESELDEGQAFKNHYESSKCWAEMEVRRRMDRIPAAIHRPGIVVGDSKTGETDKYDGPYFIIKLLMRVPSWTPLANIGAGAARAHLVPVDFLVEAMAVIGARDEAIGSAFHLVDPNPRTAREVWFAIIDALGLRRPRLAVPPASARAALAMPAIRRLAQVPREAIAYFDHEATFDTANLRRILRDTPVVCPDFLSYAPVLVDYVRSHPEKSFLDSRTC